jgi:hypothetical protein
MSERISGYTAIRLIINKSNYSLKLGNNGKEKGNGIHFVRFPEGGRG